MKMKFIMLFMMWFALICGGPATGVEIVSASIPILGAPPADAVLGESFFNSGSGALCTYIEEKYAGRENKFWSKDFRNESVECKPANTGTLPIILLPDAPRTEILNMDAEYYYSNFTFTFEIPNAVKDAILNDYRYVVKLYIVDTKTGKLFKVNQYKYLPTKIMAGSIEHSWPGSLCMKLTGSISMDYLNVPKSYIDLNVTGSGIYDFIVEVIDPENNRSWAAVPINVQYIAPQ